MLSEPVEQASSSGLGHAAESERGPDVVRETGKQGPAPRDLSLTMLLREFIFCAALALTTYGALHTSPPKVSRHPPATRFFPAESPVLDWYRGQLGPALSRAAKADISLVMYYAPWDAECQHVRREFDIAAQLLGDKVHFAAINCWNPGSECRLQHNKIPFWPVIMAYTVSSKGILYRGPRDASSLVRFVELVSRPLHRVASLNDLVHLVAVCDAVAVAFTPLSSTFKHYNTWYSAALKWREADPLGSVCLAVVTSDQLAAELGCQRAPGLRYLLWNTTIDYEGGPDEWTESELVDWTHRQLARAAVRVNPTWHKSSTLQHYMGDGPVLVLFTPLEPLYRQQPAYDLLREVAMEYSDCSSGDWTQEVVRLQRVERLLYQLHDPAALCHRPCHKISPQVKLSWHNTTDKKSTKNDFYSMLLKNGAIRAVTGGKTDSLVISPPAEECVGDFFSDRTERGQCEAFEKEEAMESSETSMVSDDDAYSARSLLEARARHECRLNSFAASRARLVLPARQVNYTTLRGLACRSNSTLRFIAMDSIRSHHFAESLGVDVTKRDDNTAVVILDSKLESQYVLSERYGERSIRDFIANYTRRTLKRHLREAVSGETSHRHGGAAAAAGGGEVVVEELTSRSFGRFVKKSGETAIVLVCGGACPSHVTRAALSAARLLARHGLPARVLRLDALANDLAVQYTLERYPAVLVLPKDRRLEMRAYPSSLRVTRDGLVALVSRTLGPPTELSLQLAMCDTAYTEVKKQCLRDMRTHTASLINSSLKQWRRATSERVHSALLTRLINLRQVSWHLHEMHESHLRAGDHRLDRLLESLSVLAKTWNLRLSVVDNQR